KSSIFIPLLEHIHAKACLHGLPVIFHSLHEQLLFFRSTVCLFWLFQSSSSVTSAKCSSLVATLTTFRLLLIRLSSFFTAGRTPSAHSFAIFFLMYLFSIISSLNLSTSSCRRSPFMCLI